ncbi:MAG: tryptophan synthase subunit alpha [Pseudomonadota bacterium]|nr:tryptophan synthase subunit alpha [Pseudomonadota bacterium]
MSTRIGRRFTALKEQNRAGLVTFVTAGDPEYDISRAILSGLPDSGADIIELGMPFSDPMADGPSIQAAGQRALKAGQNMKKTLAMVEEFRAVDDETPIVLMGYFNPIYQYGVAEFAADAHRSGVDGLIVVDTPLEEDDELRVPAEAADIDFIRLVTPATGDARIVDLVSGARGFIYYVSVTGITGAGSALIDDIAFGVGRVRRATGLPVAVGFGVRTPDQAAEIARVADGVVIGSAIVNKVAAGLDDDGRAAPGLADDVLSFVKELSAGVTGARK